MEELIVKARKGDEEAFTQIFLKLRHDLYKIAKMRLIHDEDIEDAIQETMLEVYKSIRKLKQLESFKMWTIRILINKCNKIYRKRKEKDFVPEEEVDKYVQQESRHLTESDLDFYFLIKSLDYEERMVLTLFYLEDYPIKTISNILQMNENTVKTKLARAKQKLKEKYKEEVI